MTDQLKLHPSLFEPSRERCRLGACRGACCVNGMWVDIGHVQRILAAVAAVAVAQAAELGLFNLAGKSPMTVPLMYLNVLLATTAAACVLFRPTRYRARPVPA